MPLLDSPEVELVVYWHGGRWVDANGNEVDKKTADKSRRAMKKHLENLTKPAINEPPPDEPDDDDDGVEEEGGAYAGWKVPELKQEVTNRNADRATEDEIVPESNKRADLVAALEADDEDEAE